MSKMTFKQFLTEVDVGDLQLAQQAREKEQAAASQQQAQGAFKSQVTADSPSQGDVIKAQAGNFIVTAMDMNGIHLKQLGGKRTAVLPHGTKFKATGQNTQGGKPIFTLI